MPYGLSADLPERCAASERALRAQLRRAQAPALAPLLSWLDRRDELPTVESLAAYAGFTERTLERRFQTVLGIRPKQHLRFLRFERARALLERGGLRGAEIAAEAYFTDEAHFIHEFRRFAGVTPGDYRPQL